MGGLKAVKPFRLHMFFSNKYAYAQVVRVADGNVVASASTIEAATRESLKAAGVSTSCVEAAGRIGELLAQRGKEVGLSGVHWRRRHGERYHGKIKSLLTGMEAAGLRLM